MVPLTIASLKYDRRRKAYLFFQMIKRSFDVSTAFFPRLIDLSSSKWCPNDTLFAVAFNILKPISLQSSILLLISFSFLSCKGVFNLNKDETEGKKNTLIIFASCDTTDAILNYVDHSSSKNSHLCPIPQIYTQKTLILLWGWKQS